MNVVKYLYIHTEYAGRLPAFPKYGENTYMYAGKYSCTDIQLYTQLFYASAGLTTVDTEGPALTCQALEVVNWTAGVCCEGVRGTRTPVPRNANPAALGSPICFFFFKSFVFTSILLFVFPDSNFCSFLAFRSTHCAGWHWIVGMHSIFRMQYIHK